MCSDRFCGRGATGGIAPWPAIFSISVKGGLLRQRRDPRHCAFEVRNEQRDLLFVLRFQEVIESCNNRKQTRAQGKIEQQR